MEMDEDLEARVNYLVCRIGDGVLTDELQLDQLQQLICVGDTLENGAQIFEGLVVANGGESGKCIPLAGGITL